VHCCCAPQFIDQLKLLLIWGTFFGHQCSSIFGEGIDETLVAVIGSLVQSWSREREYVRDLGA